MSWVAAAIGTLEVGKGIYGAVSANQSKQRNKGFINDAYRVAQGRLGTRQGDIREQTNESLNARGLLGGGVSSVHAALFGQPPAAGTDLASMVANRNESEFAIERHDLDSAHTQSLNENSASALNAEIGSIAGGVEGAIGAYSTKQDMNAASRMRSPTQSQTRTPIQSALLSGSAFDGIHPTDPLGDPSSAWHLPKTTIIGNGQPNYSFNTGVG